MFAQFVAQAQAAADTTGGMTDPRPLAILAVVGLLVVLAGGIMKALKAFVGLLALMILGLIVIGGYEILTSTGQLLSLAAITRLT